MTWKGWLVSVLVVLHFSFLALVYVGNWQRSGVQDAVISLGHPYLIGLNWHVELLPIDWYRANQATLRYRMVVQESGNTETLMRSDSRDWDRDRKHQFLRIIVSFLEADDNESATRILHSVVKHQEKVTGRSLTKISVQKQESRESPWVALLDANVVRLNEQEFGLVPIIDPQRSVRSLKGSSPTESKQ